MAWGSRSHPPIRRVCTRGCLDPSCTSTPHAYECQPITSPPCHSYLSGCLDSLPEAEVEQNDHHAETGSQLPARPTEITDAIAVLNVQDPSSEKGNRTESVGSVRSKNNALQTEQLGSRNRPRDKLNASFYVIGHLRCGQIVSRWFFSSRTPEMPRLSPENKPPHFTGDTWTTLRAKCSQTQQPFRGKYTIQEEHLSSQSMA